VVKPSFLERTPSHKEGVFMESITQCIKTGIRNNLKPEEVVNGLITVLIAMLPREEPDYVVDKMLEATQAAAWMAEVEFDYGIVETPDKGELH